MQLRDYQEDGENALNDAWARSLRFLLAVFPTGSGKTVLFARILLKSAGQAVAIAHRQELVSQISMALAFMGVEHDIIAPKKTIQFISTLHRREFGRCFYRNGSRVTVAGVRTLNARKERLKHWGQQVGLWVIDEAHHLLRDNEWGNAVKLFPNAKGLGVTATPNRADGRGLGAHADGVFESMYVGPPMRELIRRGYLSDYRIVAPLSDMDVSQVALAANGDFNRKQLSEAARKSHIVGDVVASYLKYAPGKLGITFATDVEAAGKIAAEFRAAGVPAEVVSAKTPEFVRVELVRQFRNGEILQLVNVDLFGEGFDLPGLEVVSMARPTASFPLFCQQFGRALRPLEGKENALIIDHVDNVLGRHGLPDGARAWSLDSRERRPRGIPDPDMVPTRACSGCSLLYERALLRCPYCGTVPEPAGRSAPEQVDGDLVELDVDTLAMLRGEVARIDRPAESVWADFKRAGAGGKIAGGAETQHRVRQEAQRGLRDTIAWWAGYQVAAGRSDQESYKRFYLKFGLDVLSALALGRKDAEALEKRIKADYQVPLQI